MSEKELSRENEEKELQAAEDKTKKPLREDAGEQFTGLPIESLICKPIVAVAQGQQELTATYIDGIKKLAYQDGDESKTKVLDFSYERPLIKQDGSVGSESCTVKAPLLSLVPLPAFTMDELTVDFDMEEKSMEMSEDKKQEDVNSAVSYSSWFGLDVSITGNVSSDSDHKRQTDSTAAYEIHAKAVQQPPSESMAKLNSLLTQAMEPIKKE